MGKALCERYPEVRERFFDRANQVLGIDLTALCFEGPEEELVKTENQQPAIYLVSAAIDAMLRERGLQPEAVAGHSLGEYSALEAAGVLDFEEGLRLTRRRGELMASIAEETGGIMAAILGLPADRIDEICVQVSSQGVVEIANFNSPNQTVISGEEGAVRTAMELARQGAQRVIELNVSAPFHCSLMAPLASAFEPALRQATMREPAIPVVANVTAGYERSTDEIRHNLIEQLDSAVRWTESIQRLVADGFDTFVEVGPGKVLTGLMRGIDPSVTAYATNDPGGIEKVIDAYTP